MLSVKAVDEITFSYQDITIIRIQVFYECLKCKSIMMPSGEITGFVVYVLLIQSFIFEEVFVSTLLHRHRAVLVHGVYSLVSG